MNRADPRVHTHPRHPGFHHFKDGKVGFKDPGRRERRRPVDSTGEEPCCGVGIY